jgi:hypothetical protein
MYAKNWQNVREKSAKMSAKKSVKMSVTNWQKCSRKICKLSVSNRQRGPREVGKMSAKNWQNCPRKIGKIVREKSGKLSAKNRQKCPRKSLAKIHTNLQIYPCKITRENVLNLHKIIVCKIIFESKKCCLLKEKYTYSWPSLSDDRLSCLTTPAEYVYISEAESDLMISK